MALTTDTCVADENATTGQKHLGALQIGPIKKSYVILYRLRLWSYHPFHRGRCGTDPLIHHGRHFGHTVHALCTVSSLLHNRFLRMAELAKEPETSFTEE